jgi:anti-sigma B factor antagonist
VAIETNVQSDDRVVVSFSGELDIACAGEIRERLAQSEVLDAPTVQFDLSDATFIDSSAIGVLVTACKRVRENGGTCFVRCEVGTISRTLEIAGLSEYFSVQTSA